MELLIGFSGWIFALILLLLGFYIGRDDEQRHYASILQREEALRHIMVVVVKRPPEGFVGQRLVRGSVVVSSNYFTRFLAAFRHFFGGRIGSYEVLLDRARREAVLRMKEEAAEAGADIIFNMRFETCTLGNIHDGRNQAAAGTVEVLAYGTAGRMRR